MTISRKDTSSIAAVIKTQVEIAMSMQEDNPVLGYVYSVAYGISSVMLESNPNFKRTKFLEACGFDTLAKRKLLKELEEI